MTSLNPVYTIENQLVEAIKLHTDRNDEEARARLGNVQLVGVNDPARRLRHIPYELSADASTRDDRHGASCEPIS